MQISIIIVSYNVKYFLEQCLRSVKKATKNYTDFLDVSIEYSTKVILELTHGGRRSQFSCALEGYFRGSFSPPWWGGNGNLKIISPPYFETLGGKFGLFPPHIPRPWGGNSVISPPCGGEIWPPQAENFEDLEIRNAKFPLQKCISASQILKIFRLRRAIFMLGFLYKIYCSG